ncbi:MAG: L,D-transpeptidase family protein [Terrimicrobiaceae bacterium]|nr:L,D-transpeptidase family protein [Terrimicrobiaceae bacterium]
MRTLWIWFLALATTFGQGDSFPQAPAVNLPKPPPDAPERIEMTRVQIVLDRSGFRPGKIDGLGGEFTQRAADRYGQANGMPLGSRIDTSAIPQPYREYTIREDDLAWVGPQASSPAAQEKLKGLKYADLWEFVAERFHCDLGFLKELNPGVTTPEPGTVLRVPDVEEFRMEDVSVLEKQRREEEKARKAAEKAYKEWEAARQKAAQAPPPAPDAPPTATPAPPPPTPSPTPEPPNRKVVLLRKERILEVHEDGRLIASFPCTPGSARVPVPTGTWKVTGNVLLPYYRWDKSVLESGVRSENAFNLPPGPNSPVGIVWIAINRPSVGMHGTMWPDQIGRNESSGCIRLANWDAFLLSQLVTKGTPVEVPEIPADT